MNVGILGPSVSNGLGKPSATPRDLGSRPLPLVEGSRYPNGLGLPWRLVCERCQLFTGRTEETALMVQNGFATGRSVQPRRSP